MDSAHEWPANWPQDYIDAANRYVAGETTWLELRGVVGLVVAREVEVRSGIWKSDIVPFSESDCGGAFDGTSVTSDADPGL